MSSARACPCCTRACRPSDASAEWPNLPSSASSLSAPARQREAWPRRAATSMVPLRRVDPRERHLAVCAHEQRHQELERDARLGPRVLRELEGRVRTVGHPFRLLHAREQPLLVVGHQLLEGGHEFLDALRRRLRRRPRGVARVPLDLPRAEQVEGGVHPLARGRLVVLEVDLQPCEHRRGERVVARPVRRHVRQQGGAVGTDARLGPLADVRGDAERRERRARERGDRGLVEGDDAAAHRVERAAVACEVKHVRGEPQPLLGEQLGHVGHLEHDHRLEGWPLLGPLDVGLVGEQELAHAQEERLDHLRALEQLLGHLELARVRKLGHVAREVRVVGEHAQDGHELVLLAELRGRQHAHHQRAEDEGRVEKEAEAVLAAADGEAVIEPLIDGRDRRPAEGLVGARVRERGEARPPVLVDLVGTRVEVGHGRLRRVAQGDRWRRHAAVRVRHGADEHAPVVERGRLVGVDHREEAELLGDGEAAQRRDVTELAHVARVLVAQHPQPGRGVRAVRRATRHERDLEPDRVGVGLDVVR
eukprot:scaffold18892_cov64-Phaeocystis_antarctica.AAC.4